MALPERCATCKHPPMYHWQTIAKGKLTPIKCSGYRCKCDGYIPDTYQGYTVEEALEDAKHFPPHGAYP